MFWLGIYLKEDRREPEPRSLLTKLFLGGILAGLAGLIIEGAAVYIFFDPAFFYQEINPALAEAESGNLRESIIIYVLVAPFVEEFVKYLAIKKIGFPSKYFNQIVDGVIYAVTVALGFALFENFLYFGGYLSGGIYSLLAIFVLRMFMSTLLHTLSTGWMGYWMGKAKFNVSSRKKFILIGFGAAVIIHAIFNFLMITGMLFYAVLVLVIVSALFFERIRSADAQMFWYPDKK